MKIPFVALLGENELEKKEFTLKEMSTGKETSIKMDSLEKLKDKLK